MSGPRDLLAEAKKEIHEVDPDVLEEKLNSGFLLLDVREREEFSEGHIPKATSIPRGFLELRISGIAPSLKQPIAVYCAGGSRSALAAKTLQEMGYQEVVSLAGGINAWKQAKKEVKVPRALSSEQRARYGRHILLPNVGEEGQQKLLEAKVLLVGAGGLGSPAALYLAAAGVGTLGIADADQVELSNLQRQILHSAEWLGRPKVDSAEKMLRELNSDVKVIKFNKHIGAENVLEVIKDFDIVIDGTDNFPTRYLLNDACVLSKKANIHGAIFRFDGQLSVFDPSRGGPCYRCLYPEPPPPEMVPSCHEAGVFGVLPGVIGVLQATEAIKLILEIGEPLLGRLLLYDALEQRFHELRITRDPGCNTCGANATFHRFAASEVVCRAK
jgi:molybdopterin/thiamine biosynthesis adenylyltransferase/rhodanese-related sulfurtransferase